MFQVAIKNKNQKKKALVKLRKHEKECKEEKKMDDKIDKTEESGDIEVISSSETAKVINSSEPKQNDAEQSSYTNFIGSDQHLFAHCKFNTEEYGDEIVEQHTIAEEPGQILDTIYGTDTSEDGSLLHDNGEGGRMLYWQFPGIHKTDCELCGTSFFPTEYGEIYCTKGCPDEAIEKLDETTAEVLKSSETDKYVLSEEPPTIDKYVMTTECGNILKVVDYTECALCGTHFIEYGDIYCKDGCPNEALERLDDNLYIFVYFNHLCEAVVQTYQITGLKSSLPFFVRYSKQPRASGHT